MTILKITLSLFLFAAVACNSTKSSTNTSIETSTSTSTTTSETAMENQKMIDAGFKKGIIVASKGEGDCPYTIKMEDAGPPYFLDPQNLEDIFKKDGEKIWVKFTGLRMMNRCEKANPVSINEIQKRK